jgi:hypothetical protein
MGRAAIISDEDIRGSISGEASCPCEGVTGRSEEVDCD